MGFLSNLTSAVIKTATLPIAVVKDVAKVAVGEEPDSTKKQVESAAKGAGKALNELV